MKYLVLLFVAWVAYALGHAAGFAACRRGVVQDAVEAARAATDAATDAAVALERCEDDLVRASAAPPLRPGFGMWLALTQEFRAEVCPGLAVQRVRKPVTVAVLEAPRVR